MIEYDDSYNDIDAEDIHNSIPRKLNVKYLSEALNELDGDITGIMYGLHLHLFCATTIKIKNKIKMVIFLVDTRSSVTFISREVLHSFGIEIADPDICILGMPFLNENKVSLHAFCGDDIFYLNFDEEFEEKGMNLRRKKGGKLK
ncbi:499_t:CDS:2, partial [Rhizophagus irregularis]